jgi:hypothetical protein
MEAHPYWNGGRKVDVDGYVKVHAPEEATARGQKDPRVFEHILVMERHLGRRLQPDEIVHHLDHRRRNNAIENLQVMTRSEHTKYHAAIRKERKTAAHMRARFGVGPEVRYSP